MEPWRSMLASGDPEGAWDLFAKRYRPIITATIRRVIRDPDDLMDVFSSVTCALSADGLARLRRFDPQEARGARFSTWLVVVVRNLAVDWLRAHRAHTARMVSLPPDLPIHLPNPAEAADLTQRLRQAMAPLPADIRLATLLFVVDGLPAAAVARLVGWPNAKTVYNRVYRALTELRAALEDQGIGRDDL